MAEDHLSKFEQLSVQLRSHSRKKCCLLAARAALRVVAAISWEEARVPSHGLQTLRALLLAATRSVGSELDTEWMSEAAYTASGHVHHGADMISGASGEALRGENPGKWYNLATAAGYAGEAANSAAYTVIPIENPNSHSLTTVKLAARTAVFCARIGDATMFSERDIDDHPIAQLVVDESLHDATLDVRDMRSAPLWRTRSEVPEALSAKRDLFHTFIAHDDDWSFWRHWYSQMWDGTFRNWDLAIEVAKIPDEVWEGEDALAKVAAEIREIGARRNAEKARINETLVLNETSQRYIARPIETSNSDRLQRHLSRVEDALDDILALGGGNGLTANTVEYRVIKRLVQKYPDDPERVAFDLTDVNKSISRQITVGEYADDEPLKLLQAASTACIAFVCETHDEVAKELARGIEPEPQAVSEEHALVLEEAWRVSVAMLEEEAAQTTLEDKAEILAGQVIDAAVDPMPEWSPDAHAMRSIVLRRQISRMWQQARGLATIESLARAYDSKPSKAAGVIGRIGIAADYLHRGIIILGKMLGM